MCSRCSINCVCRRKKSYNLILKAYVVIALGFYVVLEAIVCMSVSCFSFLCVYFLFRIKTF